MHGWAANREGASRWGANKEGVALATSVLFAVLIRGWLRGGRRGSHADARVLMLLVILGWLLPGVRGAEEPGDDHERVLV